MNDACAPQQAHRSLSIAQSQEVHRRACEFAPPTFHVLHLFQLGATAPACLSAVKPGSADRTEDHGSGLEIEHQIVELLARLLKAGEIAVLLAILDGLDHVDEFGAVFIAHLIKLGPRLGEQ